MGSQQQVKYNNDDEFVRHVLGVYCAVATTDDQTGNQDNTHFLGGLKIFDCFTIDPSDSEVIPEFDSMDAPFRTKILQLPSAEVLGLNNENNSLYFWFVWSPGRSDTHHGDIVIDNVCCGEFLTPPDWVNTDLLGKDFRTPVNTFEHFVETGI